MDKINKKDIDELLSSWNETKKEIAALEKKLEKYKIYAENIINEMGKSELKTSKFTLKRRIINKSILSKSDVPPEIFKKYSKISSYPVFYLSKNSSSVKA